MISWRSSTRTGCYSLPARSRRSCCARRLRQVDSPDVDAILGGEKELVLDSTVWSFGSPTFTPPDISGIVSERTTMEAMITRSDNTATDMMFKVAWHGCSVELDADRTLWQRFLGV